MKFQYVVEVHERGPQRFEVRVSTIVESRKEAEGAADCFGMVLGKIAADYAREELGVQSVSLMETDVDPKSDFSLQKVFAPRP